MSFLETFRGPDRKSITTSEAHLLFDTSRSTGINLLFGAGVSRDKPACGPIWSEMQVAFLDAVLDRMASAHWPISAEFQLHRERLNGLSVRPELFWRELVAAEGSAPIHTAMSAVGVGSPNENHVRVASLIATGVCPYAITTNFDEYVETILPRSVPVVSTRIGTAVTSPAYIKLHGSFSSRDALAYTLEHYDSLAEEHAAMLAAILPGRPLVIMGYSGYDTDVLPVIRAISKNLPWLLVVRHPGAPEDQPVLRLAAECDPAFVCEARSVEILRLLTNDADIELPIATDGVEERAAARYAAAAGLVSLPYCPMVVGIACRLAGEWELLHRYAWLTHDAFTDSRYQGSVPAAEFERVHHSLALELRKAGDSAGARIMLSTAKVSLQSDGGTISRAAAHHRAEALLSTTHSLGPERSPLISTPMTFQGASPSEVLQAVAAISAIQAPGGGANYEVLWQIGLARLHERKFDTAVAAFEHILQEVFENTSISHLAKGHFLLDYGSALFEQGMAAEDDSTAQKAVKVYQLCAAITDRAGDWVTHAKAHLMLAKLYTGGGSFAAARSQLTIARGSAEKTRDNALVARVDDFAKLVEMIERSQGT